MSVTRSLVLPSALATPLWLWFTPLSTRGFVALRDFSLSWTDLAFGFLLSCVGMLIVGLPSTAFVQRRPFAPAARGGALIAMGAIGGVIIAWFCFFSVSFVARRGDIDLSALASLAVRSGFLPGLIVATIWTIINFSELKGSPRGTANA